MQKSDDLLEEFIEEIRLNLLRLDLRESEIKKSLQRREVILILQGIIHNIKGGSCFLGLKRLEELSATAEEEISRVLSRQDLDEVGVEELSRYVVDIKDLLDKIEENKAEPRASDLTFNKEESQEKIAKQLGYIVKEVNKGKEEEELKAEEEVDRKILLCGIEDIKIGIEEEYIEEIIEISEKSLYRIDRVGEGLYFNKLGKILPIIDLKSALKIGRRQEGIYLIEVRVEGVNFGILIDKIYAKEALEIRKQEEVLKEIDVFKGQALSGNLGIIIVIDIAGLGKQEGIIEGDILGRENWNIDSKRAREKQKSLLIFKTKQGENKAIGIDNIATIERLGDREFIILVRRDKSGKEIVGLQSSEITGIIDDYVEISTKRMQRSTKKILISSGKEIEQVEIENIFKK